MVVLTRMLYCYDEVMLNIMLALLAGDNFNKVVFWSTEIYSSGFVRELCVFTWKIYYDFYALYSNIPLYKIKNKIKKFEHTHDFKHILNCFYLMFQATPHCEVFIILNMFKKKRVVKIKDMSKLFQTIEYLVHKKSMFHLINYLMNAMEQDEEKTLEYYNVFIKKITGKKSNTLKINNLYKNNMSQLLNHMLSILDLNVIKTKSKRKTFKQLPNKYIKYYDSLNDLETISPRDILREKRHFEIDDLTGTFKLDRADSNHEDFCGKFWYNWEYYSKNTPFWKKRYESYKVSWSKKEILFKNDDLLEEFYEKYSYDLDELPHDISQKSIKRLPKSSNLEFLYTYFKTINLPLNKNKIDIYMNIKY